jgi:DNA repair photolyase
MKIGITERGDAGLDFIWTKFNGPKILITKSPQNFLNPFNDLAYDFNNCIIHCTITGLGGSIWEPNVAPLDITILAYNRLIDILGEERVVLRIDPIIIGVSENNLLKILDAVRGRLRISFLDMYDHVRERLSSQKMEIPNAHENFHADLDIRKKCLSEIEFYFMEKHFEKDVEICGEPGLNCTGCVSERDFSALNLPFPNSDERGKQRKFCHCAAEKMELLSNKHPCMHNCIYCYWRTY